ncbi:uncharacterized protein CMU_016530 [Cryptosporidium muris RN66]|uniref:ISP1 C-terminal domain-containing protein n=1 Tax=Cryptosporidium muris (strain RN66) TaxID=441375 RepID=B6ACP9_CRYMR|nr:uncharacterized protein CMU_016530 [Cryptosporidium muris RN66]EEA05903.1 hypothetical protein, conserved [Cryptosporidium muris RN66]|eukprot:XP_002140252.1 hypothetical protein [Cryptosporidium muris RN66]
MSCIEHLLSSCCTLRKDTIDNELLCIVCPSPSDLEDNYLDNGIPARYRRNKINGYRKQINKEIKQWSGDEVARFMCCHLVIEDSDTRNFIFDDNKHKDRKREIDRAILLTNNITSGHNNLDKKYRRHKKYFKDMIDINKDKVISPNDNNKKIERSKEDIKNFSGNKEFFLNKKDKYDNKNQSKLIQTIDMKDNISDNINESHKIYHKIHHNNVRAKPQKFYSDSDYEYFNDSKHNEHKCRKHKKNRDLNHRRKSDIISSIQDDNKYIDYKVLKDHKKNQVVLGNTNNNNLCKFDYSSKYLDDSSDEIWDYYSNYSNGSEYESSDINEELYNHLNRIPRNNSSFCSTCKESNIFNSPYCKIDLIQPEESQEKKGYNNNNNNNFPENISDLQYNMSCSKNYFPVEKTNRRNSSHKKKYQVVNSRNSIIGKYLSNRYNKLSEVHSNNSDVNDETLDSHGNKEVEHKSSKSKRLFRRYKKSPFKTIDPKNIKNLDNIDQNTKNRENDKVYDSTDNPKIIKRYSNTPNNIYDRNHKYLDSNLNIEQNSSLQNKDNEDISKTFVTHKDGLDIVYDSHSKEYFKETSGNVNEGDSEKTNKNIKSKASVIKTESEEEVNLEINLPPQGILRRLSRGLPAGVVLKDGSPLRCTIAYSQGDNDLTLTCDDKIRSIPWSDIQNIITNKNELRRINTRAPIYRDSLVIAIQLNKSGHCIPIKFANESTKSDFLNFAYKMINHQPITE